MVMGKELLELLKKDGIAVFRGVSELSSAELRAFALSIPNSHTIRWDFGDIMEMRPDENPKNYLFSRENVPYHWDGAFHVVPDFLVFNCIEAPEVEKGGETLFADTKAVLSSLTEIEKNHLRKLQITYKTKKLSHYGGEFTSKVVTEHPLFHEEILRYAEEVETKLNPVTRKFNDPVAGDHFSKILMNKLYDPDFMRVHKWKKGDLVIVDNHRFLHGRNSFSGETKRHLRRIQIGVTK